MKEKKQPTSAKRIITRGAILSVVKSALFITVLTAVFVVPKLQTTTEAVATRWHNIPIVFVIALVLSVFYRYLFVRHFSGRGDTGGTHTSANTLPILPEQRIRTALYSKQFRIAVMVLSAALLVLPFVVGIYHVKILTLVFIYIIFSLGLNVVVGLSGMLCLGQAFFLGIGAYTYALLNTNFDVGFYPGLLAGSAVGIAAGVLFAVVTLRLRGDYLAIVTLGLSEIFRLVMTNVNFTGGPRGIPGIAKPGLPWLELDFFGQSKLLYFISFLLAVLCIRLVRGLEHSRFGRSWEAFREDDIAGAAMGVNTAFVRVGVFAINGFLGGIAGVLFAANTSFINPNSFSILVSVTALCVVVLGGLGSSSGVVLGSIVLIMLPEYLRFFSQYRMIVFGAILVFMMLFRPGGIIPKTRTEFLLQQEDKHA